jgi:hypothetical protein
MLKKTSILVAACFVILSPMLSFGFDCNKPDFGATLQELNKDGYFIKYLEKDGVSYYNYTGPCRMEIHSDSNPAISYGFVDDQLYARIISLSAEGDMKVKLSANSAERISRQIGTSDIKIKQDGEWTLSQWVNEKEKTKFKLKVHSSDAGSKSAFYYEPLREKLKAKSGVVDPVDEME